MLTISAGETSKLLTAAEAMRGKGDLVSALKIYEQLLEVDLENAGAWCERGNLLADLGHLEAAIASYDRAIRVDPGFVDAFDFRGIALAQSGRMPEALDSLDKAIALAPENLNALSNRANVLKALKRYDDALAAQDQLVAVMPEFAPAHANRGNTLLELDRLEEAVASFDQAIALDPTLSQAHLNRAHALVKLVRRDEAIASLRRSIECDPYQPVALLNLGELLATSGQMEEAVSFLERAVSLDPGNVEACLRLGDALLGANRPGDAIACYQRVIALDPESAEAHSHLGAAFQRLNMKPEALSCFARSLELNPNDPPTLQTRGMLQLEVGDQRGSFESHERAFQLMPDFPYQAGLYLHAMMRLSDWANLDEHRSFLRQSVVAGGQYIAPFDCLVAIGDPALQLRCAELFVRHQIPHGAPQAIPRKAARPERLRIGYFTSDVREHATMRLLMETLEAHDREKFEVILFSFGPEQRDEWWKRAELAVDKFLDLHAASDEDLLDLARQEALDIAVDLKGFTAGNRTAIFFHRVAPIQVSYLGFPGTLGMPGMDYLFADPVLVPEHAQPHYSEKIVYLPGSYQPNCRVEKREPLSTRSDHGLPDDAFVYCSFNQNYKILPEMFALWMRILQQVPRSVLWLWVSDDLARDNLRAYARALDIDDARLIFAGRLSVDQHLDRLKLADLFLDTLPCNAHTTASDALKAGLPLLTCPREAFASRVAASLLTALDLPELIAKDPEEYEAVAVTLGTDPDGIRHLKEKVVRNGATSTLFDPVHAARKLERAYQAIYDRYDANLEPDHISL
jgi:protein O-GlcNAc transferase